MSKFADLLLIPENVAEMTKAEVDAMGQPSAILSNMLIPSVASCWKYYSGWADKIEGQVFDEENGSWRMTKYESIGVCAGIGPWNVTLM